MNNSLSIEKFEESRFKGLYVLTGILVPVFLFFSVIIFTNSPENGESSISLLLIIFGVFFLFLFLTFLILSFQKRKTLVCTPEGIKVQSNTFWSNGGQIDSVKWQEVTDTYIFETKNSLGSEEDGYMSIWTFGVESGEDYIDLLDLKSSKKRTVRDLISYVNKATQQLQYVWIPNSEVSSQQVFDSGYKYNKVSRSGA